MTTPVIPGPTDPKHDLVSLRMEIARLKGTFEDLAAARKAWDDYANKLRGIAEMMQGQHVATMNEAVRTSLILAEEHRLKARTAIRGLSWNFAAGDEFYPFFEHNLRLEPKKLFEGIAEFSDRVGYGGTSFQVVTRNCAEAKLCECEARLDEYRVTVERDLRNKTQLVAELERTTALPEPAPSVPTLLPVVRKWIRKAGSVRPLRHLWGFLRWAFEDWLKGVVAAVVLAMGGAGLGAILSPAWRDLLKGLLKIVTDWLGMTGGKLT